MTLAAAVLAAAGAAPAFAATHHRHHLQVARPSRPLHMYAGEVFAQGIDMMGDTPIDAKRAEALHECSAAASKYSFSAWQTAQFAAFGTCMVNHGETP